MLVRFISSETGEIIMFADAARLLLQALGKASTARGAFTRDEMAAAAHTLRAAVAHAEGETDETSDVEGEATAEPPIALGRRAWPLIDMLERTARGGPEANIVWEAAQDF